MPSTVSTDVSEVGKKHAEPISPLVNLGNVMQQVLRKYQANLRGLNVILRCEQLPIVTGNLHQVVKLIDHLISLIVNYPPFGSKLFLYISCNEENSLLNKKESVALKKYTIQFHTNINADKDWMMHNQEKLAECKNITIEMGGTFTAHEIKNTGRLFSITLPGKIQQ